jgi:hypothetical protein
VVHDVVEQVATLTLAVGVRLIVWAKFTPVRVTEVMPVIGELGLWLPLTTGESKENSDRRVPTKPLSVIAMRRPEPWPLFEGALQMTPVTDDHDVVLQAVAAMAAVGVPYACPKLRPLIVTMATADVAVFGL